MCRGWRRLQVRHACRECRVRRGGRASCGWNDAAASDPAETACHVMALDASRTSWRCAYLRHRLPIGPALPAGLLTRAGAEFLAGGGVVHDLVDGRPRWLIRRWLGDTLAENASGTAAAT